jgi:signal transduction histidine kinase
MSAKLKLSEDNRREMMQHIAHELRTPLSTMMTAHYVLTQGRVGPVNAEQLRLLGAIRKNIDRLTDFSYDFLDLAKIEAGMMQYSLERTDLVGFIEPLIEEARLNASQKEMSIVFDTMATPEVLIDRKRFSQVATNLLSNAIKYSENGGKIVVSVLPADHGAKLMVADNGPGIAPDDLQRVFEKFFRVRSADGKGSRGTGVGLALVKAVTEALGGSVEVQSQVGEGSTFVVTLPPAPPEIAGVVSPKTAARIGHG